MRGLGTLYPHRDRCVKASLRFEGDAVNSRRWRSKALVEVSRWAQAELYEFPMRVARRGAFTGLYCKNYGKKNSWLSSPRTALCMIGTILHRTIYP